MPLSAGCRLGPYEIVSPLGAGGMGEVYRARDPRLSREIAIKVLPAEVASDPERLKRFEQETRSASALNHPNIVSVYDIGQTDSTSWMAMELVEGKSLRELLAAGPLPVKKVIATAGQIAEGLAKAHAAGIVHRDLKPENVMVTADGLVKILDFGLAKLSPPLNAADPQSLAPTLTQQTTPGVVLGTVGYMSPEQASGHAVDFRSDQFSFGAILYEMASGRRAFQRGNAIQTLSAILRDEPAPLSAVAPTAPAALQGILERCLAKDPEERYGSTKDLARDLASLKDGGEAAASAARVSGGTKRRVLWVGAALLLLGFLAGTALFLRSRSPAAGGPVRARSIAVLPLQNLGGRPEDEYFADGMTESLITDLAKVPGMLVIARNSAFRYKGEKIDIKRVGEELDVNYVLEGSVQRSGGRVRINAQLIDVESGFHLWADRYDRSPEDVFALQDDISAQIAGALRVKLAPSEAKEAGAVPTKNLEAYDAYLRGRHLSQTSPGDAGQESAISMFERAVALDPEFALAHAALARSYAGRLFNRDARREWEEKAFAEIEKALSLDPNLPEAYLARAQVLWNRSNDFPHERAAKDLRRALSLNPGLAGAHSDLAGIYYHVGLFEESVEESKLARKLDPHEPHNVVFLAAAYLFWQKYESAVAEYESYEAAGRRSPWKALALSNLNRDEEAVSLIEDFLARDPKDPAFERQRWEEALAVYAVLLSRAGDYGKAEQYIARAIESDTGLGHFHHSEYNIASAYALMGKPRQAVEWLQKSSEHGFPCYPLFATDPNLSSLRADPEYQSLLRKMKAEWEHYRATL